MNVPVLVVLVAASVCGIGLREAKRRCSLPGLSTHRCYLWRGDDGVRILSIVLLPSAAQQTWLPMETSIKKKNTSYLCRHLSKLFSISVKDL